MEDKLIALAIPFFFILIGVELWAARRRGADVYRFHDAVVDMGCGMTQQVLLVFMNAAIVGIYVLCHDRFRLMDLPATSVGAWVFAFFAVDFIYYWWHRLSHEVNALWAAHIVHHQSEDYNLAVALRQSVLTPWTSLPFYLPLAFIGVSPVVFVATVSLSTLYQFWIHTRLVGKPGPLGWVLNMPAHHRVHHAVQERYLDKNYGATLIVWDRLFGTYEDEHEEPVYGLVKPLDSFNPHWAQVHRVVELWRLSRLAPTLREKVLVWFKSPAWHAPWFPQVDIPDVHTRGKYDPAVSRPLAAYVGFQFLIVSVATFLLLYFDKDLGTPARLALAALVLLAVSAWGALFERRAWALPVELGRLALFGVTVVVAARALVPMPLLAPATAALCALMAVWVVKARAAAPVERAVAVRSAG